MQTGRWLWGGLALAAIVAAVVAGPPIYRTLDARRTASAALSEFYRRGAPAAIERLEGAGSPRAVLMAYNLTVREIYDERRAIPAIVTLSRAGIDYGRAQSELLAPDDGERSQLLRQVKALTYNLGSFTWPGWEGVDPGAFPPEVRAIGLDAARENLELAVELERPAAALSAAHWLLGAQLLAAGRLADARVQFEHAALAGEAAAEPGAELLGRGFASLTDIVADPLDAAARAELERIRAALEALPGGSVYASQLAPALEAFGPPPEDVP